MMTAQKQVLWRNRNFLTVWLGQSVSMFGTRVSYIAWIWWVLDRTDSAGATAAIGIAAALPHLLFGPFAGAIVDRLDRRKVLLWMDVINAAVYGVAAIFMFTGVLQVWHVYVFSALSATVMAFHRPSLRSSIPNLVDEEQLTVANSFYQVSRGISGFAGLLVGGILVSTIGEAPTLLLDGVTFLLAGLSLMLVVIPSPRVTTTASPRVIFQDTLSGFRFLFERRALFYVILMFGLVNFLLAPIGVLFSMVAKDIYNAGVRGFGMLNASVSAGFLVGGFVAVALKRCRQHGWVIISCLVLLGVTLFLFGVSRSLYLSMGFLAALGIVVSIANVFQAVVVQRNVPNELQGRAFAAQFAITEGLQPISLALLGSILAVASIPTVLMVSGLVMILASLGAFAVRGLKEL